MEPIKHEKLWNIIWSIVLIGGVIFIIYITCIYDKVIDIKQVYNSYTNKYEIREIHEDWWGRQIPYKYESEDPVK